MKSEIQRDITVSYFTKLLEQLTSKSGEAVVNIARECYKKFNAKLEKVLPGSMIMQFSLPAQKYENASITVESLRGLLQTTLEGLLRSEYVRIPELVTTTTVSLK